MSILSLFPKASGRIRTFLAYYDSRHSLKRAQGSGPCVCFRVCVWICLGCFLLICARCPKMPLVLFPLLFVLIVLQSLNPSSRSEKCYRDAAPGPSLVYSPGRTNSSGVSLSEAVCDAQFKFFGDNSLMERQFLSYSKLPQSSLKTTYQILHRFV